MALSIDKNMIDKDEYPQTAEIERRCVHMMADLWNAPESRQHRRRFGDRIVGGVHARRAWRPSGAGGRSAGRPASRPTSPTWCAARCRWCGTSSPSTGTSRCARCRCRPGTTRWTPTTCSSGSTRTRSWSCPPSGSPTPAPTSSVKPLADALDQLQADTGLDVDIHVDGASGAFLAPFCAPDVAFDFRLPRVKSISTSGHKFGLAPLGVGWVVWRDVAELPDDLIFHVNYLGGDMPVFQINFSRPAGQIVAQYYDFLRLGREGYRRIHQAVLRHRPVPRRGDRQARARSSCSATATRRPASPPSPGGSARASTPATPCSTWPTGCASKGWQVPAYTLTGDGVRHPGAADPRAPGGQPRSGLGAARRLPRRRRPLRQAPGHRVDDEGRVRRVQPPLTRPIRW